MTKLYCYVDETGQDTRGKLFIVSVVVTEQEREQLRQLCEAIERDSRKGQRKWIKTAYNRRLAYIQRVMEAPIFQGRLNFAVYQDAQDYTALTVRTIARALDAAGVEDYKATVFIDGLPRSLEQAVGLQLRLSGAHAKKVKGIKKDENDALIRLADAVCGLVRSAMEDQPEMKVLFEQGIRAGVLQDLSGK